MPIVRQRKKRRAQKDQITINLNVLPTYSSDHSDAVEQRAWKIPLDFWIVRASVSVPHLPDNVRLKLVNDGLCLQSPVAAVQRVEALRNLPEARHGCVAVLGHKVVRPFLGRRLNGLEGNGAENEVADDEDADADLAEDEGEEGAEVVLELLPRRFGRWARWSKVNVAVKHTFTVHISTFGKASLV